MSRGERLFLGGLAALLTGFYAVCVYKATATINGRHVLTFVDDTYISMRYARHLIAGHGLVYNVGERPVEGFTNFLWTAWAAALTLVRQDPSYLMVASAAALHIAAVLVFYVLLRGRLQVAIVPAAVSTLLLGGWIYIQAQVLNALEGPLLLFLLVASLLLLWHQSADAHRRQLIGALVAGTLPLVRPDGIFLTALLVAVYLASPGPAARRRHTHAVAALLFLAPFVLLTTFRVAYFGDVLPNTFYLKVWGRPGRIEYGVAYVKRFLESFYGTVLLVPLVLWAAWRGSRVVRLAAAGVVGVLAYVAYQGGDIVDWWRFMIPVLPLFLILFAVGTTLLFRTVRFRWGGTMLCVVLLTMWAGEMRWALSKGWPPSQPVKETADNIRLGFLLKAVCAPDALAADFWAGATPYYSDLRTVDMLGRSDRWIARRVAFKPAGVPGHDKFDIEYVLTRRPDVIVSAYPVGVSKADLEAGKKSEFVFGAYLLERLTKDSSYVPIESPISRRWHGIYARRDSSKCDWGRAARVERQMEAAGEQAH